VYWKPLVPWIWIGCVIMAFGGVVSLSDRRWRVGAAARASRHGLQPVPAAGE
jgi:cytochrome c-type biogenesis protein CcmF